jgi:hypothetical protein
MKIGKILYLTYVGNPKKVERLIKEKKLAHLKVLLSC